MKKKLFVASNMAIFLLAANIGAAEEGYVSHENYNTDPDYEYYMSQEQWLARINGEFHYDNLSDNLRFSIETIQPIYLSPDLSNTFFVQARASYEDELWTGNIGLGYRNLTADENWIYGINAWFDRNWDPDHKRTGIGGELIGKYTTIRANYYNAYTDWITTKETATLKTQEKALDGFDLEIDMPLPYMPWGRFSIGYYHWEAEELDDIKGVRAAAYFDITRSTRFELGLSSDNEDTTGFAKLRIALGEPAAIETSYVDTGFSQEKFHARNLKKHLLDPVERNHQIVVERKTTNIGTGARIGGVVIGRSQ